MERYLNFTNKILRNVLRMLCLDKEKRVNKESWEATATGKVQAGCGVEALLSGGFTTAGHRSPVANQYISRPDATMWSPFIKQRHYTNTTTNFIQIRKFRLKLLIQIYYIVAKL